MSYSTLLRWLLGDEDIDEETKKEFNEDHNEFIKKLTWKQYIFLYLPLKFYWKFFRFLIILGSTTRNMNEYNCSFSNPGYNQSYNFNYYDPPF